METFSKHRGVLTTRSSIKQDGTFCNIGIEWKLLTIFAKSSSLDLWLGSQYVPGISKVKCNLKVLVKLYTKVHGKINTDAANTERKAKCLAKACKNFFWLNNLSTCSEMFWKIGVLKFSGKHIQWRPLLSRCTACSTERY